MLLIAVFMNKINIVIVLATKICGTVCCKAMDRLNPYTITTLTISRITTDFLSHMDLLILILAFVAI